MKLNRSLGISSKIQELQTGNIISLLEQEFPTLELSGIEKYDSERHRVYTPGNTLLTMILTATQSDKSLKNSVSLYYGLHQQHRKTVIDELSRELKAQKRKDDKTPRKAGRPREYKVDLPKSLAQDISLNTAAYSKARTRLPLVLVEEVFKQSRIKDVENGYSHWQGYRVLIGDGTYVQMQDSESINQEYQVKYKDGSYSGYPQGLLEVLIDRGTGQVYSFKLSNRHVSELALFYEMLDEVPQKTLLLLDDLYNCYEIISKCKRKDIEFVMPAKRERAYESVETLSKGDEIIRIVTPKRRSKWLEENEPANSFLLRRIECQSPDGQTYILHTTILDPEISKEEIQLLYLTRWDVEIGIREIKTIMDVNILRSKTPEMALKELTVSLATYNLIRRIIYASIKDLPFSPKEDFIYKFYTHHKDVLMDKKGRIYSRWSTGRRRTKAAHSKTNTSKTKTQ